MTSHNAQKADSSSVDTSFYPEVTANAHFPDIEGEVLKFWQENKVFEQSVANRAEMVDGTTNAYVFYDGPPFANGLPHYGHLLTGYVKDAIARYQTMRGKRVERRFGWDCHGLPAEMGAEKALGISGRAAIMSYGIDKFNAHCKTSVMEFTGEWRNYVSRQGRWVDFDNDYKTMDIGFMESVLWAFKELYNKGLIYESMRVMPYSWAAETPVSNFETRIDNATRPREDKAATVAFKLKQAPEGAPKAENYYLLAWTTTPWTLPSNLALAVSKNLTYRAVKKEGDCYILAESSYGAYKTALGYADKKGAILETENLYVRAFEEKDYPLFQSLVGDPEVAKTTSDGILPEEVIRAEFDRFLKDQKKKNFSQWAVFRKEDDAFIGRAGFDNRDYDQFNTTGKSAVELRYAYKGEFWGKGYASEMGEALLNWAADHLDSELIIAGCAAAYAPALRVLEKLGFTAHEVVDFRNQPVRYHTQEMAHVKQARSLAGEALIGLIYEPLFPYFAETKNAFRVLDGSEFVTEGDGSGVVHMAPGFGEVDQQCCVENGIEVLVPVDEKGRYTDAMFDLPDLQLKGLNVVADASLNAEDEANHIALRDAEKFGLANMRIVRWLKAHGRLVKDEPYVHNYPHCWRTDTPLIYRAMSSWYVNVQKIKSEMLKNNETIDWIPNHVQQGQMGKGIESAPDWSISRNRFWGTPIPIWKSASGKIHVCGSIEEIERLSGKKVTDLHRPFIDDVVLHIDGEDYTRIEDVFDCWFESGSMPFAQLHYPFENRQKFEANFPADFITEYIAQTRGWFYTLQVLSTALFGKAPFKHCICHGVVIDEETGLKYSKRLKNYKDPMEVMDAYGADALRFMMLASPVMRGMDLGVDPEGKFIRDVVRLHIKPLWNAYHFFTLYANADQVQAKEITASGNVLDQYILAKAKQAVLQIKTSLDAYDTPGATDAFTGFFEVLNNWYIRRSRPRFWAEVLTADKQAAYDTLYTVLVLMCKAAAPLLPFTTEAVYRGLVAGEVVQNEDSMSESALSGASSRRSADRSGKLIDSVHLQDFPDVSAIDDAADLIADMDKVRDACNTVLSIRSQENIRIRQPLAKATLYGDGASRLKPYADLIQDETNLKSVAFSDDLTGIASYQLAIHFPVAGKRLGAKMKQVAAAAKQGNWEKDAAGNIIAGGEPLQAGEYSLSLKPEVEKGAAALSSNDGVVVLDLALTPELIAEGTARDLVRMVQQARKDAGLHVSDRIALYIGGEAAVDAALSLFGDYIAEQTLANISKAALPQPGYTANETLEGTAVKIQLVKAV